MILGIDEVGRGPWAGPLVMGACILNDPREEWQEALTDSKRLTPKRRAELEPIILENAIAYGLGWVSAAELDRVGMSRALRLACRRAVTQVKQSKAPFHEIIIDGTVNFLADTPLGPHVSTLKKADLLIKEVSAASIIAKVARDRYMTELAQKYPEYGFELHVGYGTKLHRTKLETYGPCPEHRRSFRPVARIAEDFSHLPPTSSSMEASTYPTTSEAGKYAEQVVVQHLRSLGHEIITRNYKTRYYEIDIVSVHNEVIYFTEVKYRRDYAHGSPLEMIGSEKLRQMKFAAESFLHQKKSQLHKINKELRPKLAAAAVAGPKYKLEDWFPLEVV